MPRPRNRGDDHAMALAADPRRIRLEIGQHRADVQRPPAPPTLAEVIAGAVPPAMRAPIALPSRRPDRHHQALVLALDPDVLDHRFAQPEGRLPYASSTHAATAPSSWFLTVRSRNRRSTAACAPSCPEVGRSQRPDLVAKQRGRRRLSSSANPARSSRNVARAATTARRCLIRRRRPRYPATALTSTHGTCRGAGFRRGQEQPLIQAICAGATDGGKG